MIHNRPLPFIAIIWLLAIHEGELRKYCIKNATSDSMTNFTCSDDKERMEVLAVIYDNLNNQRSRPCQPPRASNCSRVFKTGQGLRNQGPYICSSLKDACVTSIGYKTNAKTCDFNFFFIEFACLQESNIMDLCGDKKKTVTSSTHLAYFPFRRNPIQNCSCVIQGGSHTLRAVDVGIPQTTNNGFCVGASLVISSNTADRSGTVTEGRVIANQRRFYTNEDLATNSERTYINYTRNCNISTVHVWFKILPEDGSRVTIYCGESMANIPSPATKTTGSPTRGRTRSNRTTTSATTTRVIVTNSTNTLPSTTTVSRTNTISSRETREQPTTSDMPTEHNPTNRTMLTEHIPSAHQTTTGSKGITQNGEKAKQSLAVILGSTIGGLAFLIIILVLFFICYRMRKRHKDHASGHNLYTEESNTVQYENVPEGGVQLFDNHTFMESDIDATTDYDHLGDVTTTTQQGKVSGSDNTNLYDRSLITEYDHIQSVPTVQSRNIHQDQIPDDTYNQLYQGRGMESSDPNTQSEQPAAAICSEIPDSADFIYRPKDQSSKPRTGSDMYSVVDNSKNKTNPTDGSKPPAYHVLEKQPHSRFEIQDTNEIPQPKEHGFEDSAAEINHEEMEFLNNDLYQSADDMNNHESHRYMNHDTREDIEFVNNDLYQSAEDTKHL